MQVRLILEKLSRSGRFNTCAHRIELAGGTKPTSKIRNLKSEKFSFRLSWPATSSGEEHRHLVCRAGGMGAPLFE
jgi:hypothetical protein